MLQKPKHPQILYLNIVELFGLERNFKKSFSFKFPVMGKDAFHQTELPKVPSNLSLITSGDGASTASLGSLFQCLSILIGHNSFFVSNLSLSGSSLKQVYPNLSLHSLIESLSPSLLKSPFKYWKDTIMSPQSFLFSGGISPAPSAFLHRRDAPVLWSGPPLDPL